MQQARSAGLHEAARMSFAVLELRSAAHDDAEALRESLQPGAAAQRYGRVWRLGQWREDSGAIFGRIGYDAPGGVAEVWNERIKDFEEQQLPAGTTSPFVISLVDLRVGFQLRPGRIRPRTFTGALQSVLNVPENFHRWRVRHEIIKISWEAWLERVERITELQMRLERPNPNYADRDEVERLIEGFRAALVNLDIRARPNDPNGIDLTDDVIRQALDHAKEHGRWRARAEIEEEGVELEVETVEEGESEWRSDAEGVPPVRRVDANPETGEADPDALRRELDAFRGDAE